MGYAQISVAYRFMSLGDNSICESRYAEFFKLIFPLKMDHSNIVHTSNITDVPMFFPSTLNEHETKPRSKRRRIENTFGPDFVTSFLIENSYCDKLDEDIVSLFLIEEDPKTYEEAMTSIDASFFKEAIKNELDSLMTNHTW